MSNDNDSKDPGPEDDGWGDAVGKVPEPGPKKAVAPEAVLSDPLKVEERVAAMRQARDQSGVIETRPTAETGAKPKAAALPAPEAAAPPAKQSAAASAPAAAPPAKQPAGQVPQQAAAGVARSPGPPTAATGYVPPASSAPVPTPASVDKPQWNPGHKSAAAPSSDMLAAAGALAEKEKQPAAQKRRKREKSKEKDPKTQLTRRQQWFLVGGSALLVLTAVCAILGWLNNKNYYFVCGTRSITAEQGSFWPYGRSPLPGEAFKPIVGDFPCESRHFEKRDELEKAFLAALIDQATRLLASGDPEHVSTAEQELQQALLLSRNPERAEERAMAERLRGDVSYWRGAAEIQTALETLRTSAEFFEEAATRRPRHSNDANAWAEHARFIGSEIDKGPRSLRKDESPKEQPHFQGLSSPDTVAKPATADPGDTPNAGTKTDASAQVPKLPIDAGVDAAPPPPRSDAALPTGGVLL